MRAWIPTIATSLTLLALLFAGGSGDAAERGPDLRDQAFQAAQWALTTSAGTALARMGARLQARSERLSMLVRTRQDLVERWERLQAAALAGLGSAGGVSANEQIRIRTEMEEVAREIETLDTTIASEFPDYAEVTNPQPLSIAEARALINSDEALIVFLVAATHSFVWAITHEDAAWIRVDIGANELDRIVRDLRSTLDPKGPLRAMESLFDDEPVTAIAPFDRGVAHELYKAFLAPLEPVLADKPHLLLVLDGPLAALPFSVLVTKPPEGRDDDAVVLRRTAWLGRKKALTTLPAVTGLTTLRVQRPPSDEPLSFRGFGNPTLAGMLGGGGVQVADAYFRGGRADVEAVRALEPLPGTERELRALAAALGASDDTIIIGDDATETAVKRADLSETRVIAFATHGLVAGELAGLTEPALVMTPPLIPTEEDDGLLTASEITALRLSADWVLLSACNTAAGDGTLGGEGLSGLARAFLYAGARAVLASHWPVRDDAAAALTTHAFLALADDPHIGRAEALRLGMSAVMDDESDPTLAHPSAWAPFVVVGEGGR